MIVILVCKQISSDSFKNKNYWRIDDMYDHLTVYKSYLYKQDLALNDRQWLIYDKTHPNNIYVRH